MMPLRGLAATLRMPDDSVAYSGIEFSLDCLGGKKLRVTHDVFLLTVNLIYIGQGILQKE
jgi:hypothetical protein